MSTIISENAQEFLKNRKNVEFLYNKIIEKENKVIEFTKEELKHLMMAVSILKLAYLNQFGDKKGWDIADQIHNKLHRYECDKDK